jgi:hypothetical protein
VRPLTAAEVLRARLAETNARSRAGLDVKRPGTSGSSTVSRLPP